MREMNFGRTTQYTFWGNVEYLTNKEALKARNELAKKLKAEGRKVRLSSTPGQIRKYSGLGQPDGTMGTVYRITVDNTEAV